MASRMSLIDAWMKLVGAPMRLIASPISPHDPLHEAHRPAHAPQWMPPRAHFTWRSWRPPLPLAVILPAHHARWVPPYSMIDGPSTYVRARTAAGSSRQKAMVKATKLTHRAARCQSIAAPPHRS